MNNKSTIPEPVRTALNQIHARLTSDGNLYGHLFAVDRNEFWKAMNASYGYRSSAIRRAVIEGRSLYRTLNYWEQAADARFNTLLTSDQIRLPRGIANICLRVLQGECISANLEKRDLWADMCDELEWPELSPECLIVPAALCGGSIMAGARYVSDYEPDEEELERSLGVESGEINDLKMTDHTPDFEASLWCSLTRADFLQADRVNRSVRLEFWKHWLVDAVDVCMCREEKKLITDASIIHGKW